MLEELIQRLFERFFRSAHFTATVLSVDKAQGVCTVQEEGGPEREGVRLVAVTGGYTSRFVVFPAVGSDVTVAVRYNRSTELYVAQCSEIEEITAQVGAFNWVLNKAGIVFNGGEKEGIPLVKKVVEKLNALEKRMAEHQHLSSSPGNPTAPDPASNPPLTVTLIDDLQNPEIKQ